MQKNNDLNEAIQNEKNILNDLTNLLNSIGEFTDNNITKPTTKFTDDYITKPFNSVIDEINKIGK